MVFSQFFGHPRRLEEVDIRRILILSMAAAILTLTMLAPYSAR
jgi:hypothetical protein